MKKKNYLGIIDVNQLDHFLRLITSERNSHDVAFGTKIIKTEHSGIKMIPDVLRLSSHSRIISEYFEICKNEQLPPLSESTCYRILNKCKASFRKSMQGLDNIKADGLDAFDKIDEIIKSLKDFNLSEKTYKELKDLNLTCLNHLKFNFIKHLKKSSSCSDHCVNYALSAENKKNIKNCSVDCDHTHVRDCNECNSIDYLFDQLLQNINNVSYEESKNRLVHFFKISKEDIFNWKYHIIRNYNQDIIKHKVLNELKEDEVYVHMDFAMKFLPMRHREKQEEWFGKKGLSWHVTCLVFKEKNDLKVVTLAHLFESVSQDVNCVIGIVDSVFEFIKNNFQHISKVYLRCDNAGYYHNQNLTMLLPMFASKHQIEIKRLDFCEPQTGKDICDRKISPMKSCLNNFINEGNDIINIQQMKTALESNINLHSVYVFNCAMNESLMFNNVAKFQNISNFHSFSYTNNEEIKCFQYYNIGNGIDYTLNDLSKLDTNDLKLSISKSKLSLLESPKEYNDLNNALCLTKKKSEFFKCDKCYSLFDNSLDLESHVEKHIEIKIPQLETSQLKYIQLITEVRTEVVQNTELAVSSCSLNFIEFHVL